MSILVLLCCSNYLVATPYQNLFKSHDDQPRSSISGIDAIYVINLDVRPEKWHRVEPILYRHGIDHSRFSAVFGMDFDVETIRTYCKKHMRPGQLGCMLSHLSIYQDALNRGLKRIWVMEDDIEVKGNPQGLTVLIDELERLDPRWDILYTDLDFVTKEGTYVKSWAFPIDKKHAFPFPLSYYTERKNLSKNIQKLRSRYGAGSMIVSRRGMEKVIRHFTTNEDIVWPIDIEIHYVPGIRQYGLRNPVVTNAHFDFNYSDTGKNQIKNYYLINSKNRAYLQERHDLLSDLIYNWLDFLGLKKTIVN